MSLLGMGARSQRGDPKVEGSMLFNGTNEYMQIGSFTSSSPTVTQMTVACWLRTDVAPPPINETILDMYQDGNDWAFYYLATAGNFRFTESDNNAEDIEESLSADTPAAGNWFHVLWRFDGSQSSANRMRIYVNNSVSQGSGNYTRTNIRHALQNGDEISVGGIFAPGSHFDGRIADLIVIEGQSLAPTQVNYDSAGGGRWKDYTGSFGNHGFRLNPQTAADLGKDMSGNGYDFSLINMDASNFDPNELPPQ